MRRDTGLRLHRLTIASTILLLTAVLASPGPALARQCRKGPDFAKRAARGLEKNLGADLVFAETGSDWAWSQLQIPDQSVPLTVDVVASTTVRPHRVAYMLSVSGLNFTANYFSPSEESLARYLAQNGFLVVGISARENNLTPETPLAVMADWGVAQHREDVRRVVEAVQRRVRLPYDVMGFSFAGPVALDYAATYSDSMERVVLFDSYSIDPAAEPDRIAEGTALVSILSQMIADGQYDDPSLSELRDLIFGALMYPLADSGIPRSMVGLPVPGNFTLSGLAHFWLIYSGFLPGLHTHLSGLPRDWPMILGTSAGYYTPALDPTQDAFGFDFYGLDRFLPILMSMDSGLIPVALIRDNVAMAVGHPSYPVDFAGVDEEVVWINSALGYGDKMYAAQRIRDTGNQDVATHVIPGYANIDLFLSPTAAQDVWPLLLP